MINIIRSASNPHVKRWRKLKQKKYREESQTFLLEGYHLVEEALASSYQVKEIILTQTEQAPFFKSPLAASLPSDSQRYIVSDELFKTLSTTLSPQGVAAVLEIIPPPKFPQDGHILLLDNLQDPGNVGTLIRSADAAGFSAVVLGEGCADLYNDKTLRATQGSLFHLAVFQAALPSLCSTLKSKEYEIWAAALEEATLFHKTTPSKKVALILGNEGQGIAKSLLEKADRKVKIPLLGRAESLNVGVAGAIIMFHLALAKE